MNNTATADKSTARKR